MNSKLILASVIMFSSSFAFADYPKKKSMIAKFLVQILTKSPPKQRFKLSKSNTPMIQVYLSISTIPRTLMVFQARPTMLVLFLCPFKTPKRIWLVTLIFTPSKEHRFTRWDDFFVIINLKRKASVVVDQQKFTGFKATVGFNTSLRYIEATPSARRCSSSNWSYKLRFSRSKVAIKTHLEIENKVECTSPGHLFQLHR